MLLLLLDSMQGRRGESQADDVVVVVANSDVVGVGLFRYSTLIERDWRSV